MNRIIRVFCRQTSYTPTDDMAFVGPPPGLFIPEHDEIHISCTFTWDRTPGDKKIQTQSVTCCHNHPHRCVSDA